jgi:hypothetical protein
MINEVAAAFAAAIESGRLDLPLPGGGRTWERWASLAELAGEDLSLARLSEGHADAVAILAELGAGPPPAGSRWGVWAAQPPGPGLRASRTAGGWRLDGIKRYCSGARTCTHALAHLGAVDIALHTARDALEQAAAAIDADPADRKHDGWRRTLRVRALVEATATEIMARVGRALGAGPLCHDEAHARRVADLTVYLRQHHAERDLAELGALAAEAGTSW